MNQLQETVTTQLRDLRQKRGLDQATLATAAGVSRSSISNIESGRQYVSLDMFVRLSEALNQNPGQLLNTVIDSRANSTYFDLSEAGNNYNIHRVISQSIAEIHGELKSEKN